MKYQFHLKIKCYKKKKKVTLHSSIPPPYFATILILGLQHKLWPTVHPASVNHHFSQPRYYLTQRFQFSCLEGLLELRKATELSVLSFHPLNSKGKTACKGQALQLMLVLTKSKCQESLRTLCSQKSTPAGKDAACFNLPLEDLKL